MSKTRLASMLFACAVAACGVGDVPDGGGSGAGSGSSGGGGDGDDSTMTVAKFFSGTATKFCNQAFACKSTFPSDAGVTFEQELGASVEACVADAEAAYPPATVEAQIAAAKIKWNAADAATCVASLTFPACDRFWTEEPNVPAACETALVGTVADGGACVVDFECSNVNAYCDDTTKKCTPDAGGARTVPSSEVPWHLQSAALR